MDRKSRIMETEYYTPDLSEFYQGFEYEELEFYYTDKGWYKNKVQVYLTKVHKATDYIESYYLNERVKRNLFKGTIRVKYLDQSDIESFGFELVGESDKTTYQGSNYDKDNLMGFNIKFSMNRSNYTYYELEYFNWYVGAKDTETTEHRMVRITRRYKDEEKGVDLFRGEIKNKSELNKLLKQLRIKDNE